MYSSLILAVSFRGVVVVAFETSATAPELSILRIPQPRKKNHHSGAETSAAAAELIGMLPFAV
jgi:hypothetical protein